jgi:endogenous inhibitor of DNA gyrase (YacG/DUF329 family)
MNLQTSLYENVKKIYGPYERKDKRLIYRIIFNDLSMKTMSYPKFVMQEHLNRFIEEPETVHHKDENPLNNSIDNLEIINRKKHAYQDAIKLNPFSFICPVCKNLVTLKGTKLHDCIHNRKKGKKGPFCSRKCAGIAIKEYNISKITVSYSKIEPQ